MKVVLLGSILSLCSVSFSDSAIQTDWSGGNGVTGPVFDWGTQFDTEESIEWFEFPGDVVLETRVEYVIDLDLYGTWSIQSGDIDGDGDMDVLSANLFDGETAWWDNLDGSGTSWLKHVVDDDFTSATSVYPVDVDGDGDMDVAGGAQTMPCLQWWENLDGLGTAWTGHTVGNYSWGIESIDAGDVDGDGDADLLSASANGDDICWWENLDGYGTSWAEHTVEGNFPIAMSVCEGDVDTDGDTDILGASYAGFITWWENSTGAGTSWIRHDVCGIFNGAICLDSRDIDGDGDTDIAGAAYKEDDIAWWENIDGSGTTWTAHPVDMYFIGAIAVYTEDVDGDGDTDILGAASDSNCLNWWENADGSGRSWIEHVLNGDFTSAHFVCSEDLNSDGLFDVIGCATWQGILWWDVNDYSPSGSLESSVLDTQADPDWGYFDWSTLAPPGTSVSFQVRASDDYLAMGEWSDTLDAPCSLEGILEDGYGYFQYRIILETIDADTTPALLDITLNWDPAGVEEGGNPGNPILHQVSPNPTASPILRFGLPEPRMVIFSVIDITGRLVLKISDEYPAGYQTVELDVGSPGIYFCKMTSGDFTATQRFVVID